jgi:hypothetical protein
VLFPPQYFFAGDGSFTKAFDKGLIFCANIAVKAVLFHPFLPAVSDLPLFQSGLVCFQASLAGYGVINHRSRVRGSAKFGHPFAHIFVLGVELFVLFCWIEYPEVGSGIRSAASSPLPSAVITGQIEVEQFFGKPGLPDPASRPAGAWSENWR